VSAPPLPEIFGNYTLGEFVEVVSPDAIGWLPQTAGWAWLGAGLLLLSIRYSWKRVTHWHRNRYRREAELRLKHLAETTPPENWLTELNKLLKITALTAFSREQVAQLSGKEWIEFLNHQCPTPPFSTEQLQLLAIGTYSNAQLEDTTRQQLVEASLNWISNHESPQHV
jgi:hypothetical protein